MLKNYFPKGIAAILSFCFLTTVAFSQRQMEVGSSHHSISNPPASHLDAAPGVNPEQTSPDYKVTALWDVQFNYTIGDSGLGGGNAGVTFTGTEFWVSRWGSDTVYRLSPTGSLLQTFTIPGVTGIRAMTYGGGFIYASNNTATVHKINPSTRLSVGTITAPITQVRMLTWDSTAASGAGGFWIGNFNTDITLMSMTGTTISSIPASTHALTGMYGCAIDHWSAGGPYLWVFAQSGTPSNMVLHRIQLPTGTPSGITHDCATDVGVGITGALAGGMFITQGLVSGKRTIGGVMQGTPNKLFGFELADPPSTDASITAFATVAGYTQIPVRQAGPMVFKGDINNAGSSTITSPRLIIEVKSGATTIWADSATGSAIAPAGFATLGTAAFNPPPGIGNYVAYATVRTVGQTDGYYANDTATFLFSITDSTYARDNGISNGGTGYAVSNTSWAYATANYDLLSPDTLMGVWIRIEAPVLGDSTYAVVAQTTSGIPFTATAFGIPVIIDDNINEYYLEFAAPVPLAAGTWAIGCYEDNDSTINLSQSSKYYTAGMNYFFTPGGGWTASGILTARFIRPKFLPGPFVVGNEPSWASRFNIYPNPTSSDVHIALQLENPSDVTIRVMNTMGQIIETRQLNQVQRDQLDIDLSNQASGIYFVNIRTIQGEFTRKVVLSK